MQHAHLICAIDGCGTRLGLSTWPPLCDAHRAQAAARKAAAEAELAAAREAWANRGQPGDLTFIPETPHEKAEHRRLIKSASRRGALGK